MSTPFSQIHTILTEVLEKVQSGYWRPYAVFPDQASPPDKGCGCLIQLVCRTTDYGVAARTEALAAIQREIMQVDQLPSWSSRFVAYWNDNHGTKEKVELVVTNALKHFPKED